jgi:hypothetical protein
MEDLDEQLVQVKKILGEGQLALVAADMDREESGGLVVIVRPLYDDPGVFGVILADIVSHIANAYTDNGFDPVRARNRVLAVLGDELDFPTDTPRAIREAVRDIPEA